MLSVLQSEGFLLLSFMCACNNSSGYLTHLDKPRLELVIDNDVIPVTLKTVFVIVHHRLGGENTDRPS